MRRPSRGTRVSPGLPSRRPYSHRHSTRRQIVRLVGKSAVAWRTSTHYHRRMHHMTALQANPARKEDAGHASAYSTLVCSRTTDAPHVHRPGIAFRLLPTILDRRLWTPGTVAWAVRMSVKHRHNHILRAPSGSSRGSITTRLSRVLRPTPSYMFRARMAPISMPRTFQAGH